MTKIKSKYLILFFAFLLSVIGAKVFHYLSLSDTSYDILEKDIEKRVLERRAEMKELLSSFHIPEYKSHKDIWQKIDSLSANDIYIVVFQSNKMVAWNSHKIPLEGLNPSYLKKALIKLENGWYLTSYIEQSDVIVVAFSLLKNSYNYENSFLQNEFSELLPLDRSVQITQFIEPSDIVIKDEKGKFLFGLQLFNISQPAKKIELGSISFYLLSILLLWILLFVWLKDNRSKRLINLYLTFATLVISFYVYAVFWQNTLFYYGFAKIFSSSLFAYSSFLPSIGHLLIFSLLVLNSSYWFFLFFKTPKVISDANNKNLYSFLAIVVFIIAVVFQLFLTKVLYIIVEHSSGNVLITKIIDLKGVAFLRISIIVIFVFAYILFLDRVISYFIKLLSSKYVVLIFLIIISIFTLFYKGIGIGDSDWTFLFLAILILSLIFAKRETNSSLTSGSYLWLSALFGLFVGFVLLDISIKKEESNRELLIENLAFQLSRDEDFVAETYLAELENQLANDISLSKILSNPEINYDAIYNHLFKFYFYGYWTRYDLQIIPCWPDGNVYLESYDRVENCYTYFYNLMELRGYKVPGSHHFHYLNQQDGNVSFFGVFRFSSNLTDNEISLFIELQSKPTFEGLGYPELLASSREQARINMLKGYSYAKYIDGKLVKRSGDYNYKPDLTVYKSKLLEKVFIKERDYSHLTYKITKDFSVILSKKTYSINEIFIFFSIIFLLFLLIGGFGIYLYKWYRSGFVFRLSIQKKIQVTFVLIMLIMLVIVAIGTILYSISQFENKHLQLLENKVQSVMSELEYKIGYDGPETYIPEDYLNYQLQMLSNVFYCDINLFGIEGKLVGTSRPEIYINGLSGVQMNSNAYYNLFYTENDRVIEEEMIGNMSFMSLYVPFLNSNNELAGFVNLPYFVGKNELEDEISSVVITILNFYLVFSFIVIGLAVFIAGQITRPLFMLQNKISRLRLGDQNEMIDYKKQDEIGEIVSEYNRMVNELSVSAEKLARTERDMAWREMAKQIAHEIKNPLTPMKLNIQHLQRMWNDRADDFENHLTRVSTSLIEQINSLSSIASEFSQFAQMPISKSEIVNLIEKIENVANLYSSHDDVTIVVENEVDDVINVQIDGEQLVSVFNNLVKNAIQAKKDGQDVEIKIVIKRNVSDVQISISDNGKGIPKELEEKLFVPSFTTKSGGMGLGLAIVHRIIENGGGEIWYESVNEGDTTFVIKLPYLNN